MSGKARLSKGLKNRVAVGKLRQHFNSAEASEAALAEYTEITSKKVIQGLRIISN